MSRLWLYQTSSQKCHDNLQSSVRKQYIPVARGTMLLEADARRQCVSSGVTVSRYSSAVPLSSRSSVCRASRAVRTDATGSTGASS
jgi:hypothetical protein